MYDVSSFKTVTSLWICINNFFRFTRIDNPLDRDNNIRKYFNLVNTSEVLYPNKLFTGTLIFNPTKPMEFKEVPIFVCNLVECAHLESVINSFVIKISGRVFFSRYTDKLSYIFVAYFGSKYLKYL